MISSSFWSENRLMLLNLTLCLLLYPVMIHMGSITKLIFIPYILYMMFSKNPQYFPALVVLSAGGSTISFLLFFSSLIFSLTHFNYLIKAKVSFLFLLSLIPFPFFIFYLILNVYQGGNIINVLSHWSLYLGIFSLFYGVVIGAKSDQNVVFGTIIAIILLTIVSRLISIYGYIRLSSFAQVYLLSIGIVSIILFSNRIKINALLKYLGLLVLILFLTGKILLKFHSLFAVLLSVFLIIGIIKGWKNMIYIFYKPIIYVLLGLMVVFIASNYQNYGNNEMSYEKFDYSNFLEYPAYIQFKIFGDRGVIWSGVWNSLEKANLWWPPEKPLIYDYELASGSSVEDVEFGAHNIPLELMRNYGFILGVIITIFYLSSLLKLSKLFYFYKDSFFYLSVITTIFSIGLSTGMTGQSTLQPNVSFTFMGLIGIFISTYQFDSEFDY